MIPPPPPPPNCEIVYGWFTYWETAASKRRIAEYTAERAAWRATYMGGETADATHRQAERPGAPGRPADVDSPPANPS